MEPTTAHLGADGHVDVSARPDVHLTPTVYTLVGMTAAFCDLALNMPLIAMKTWKQTARDRSESVWKQASRNYKKLYSGFHYMYLSYGPNVGLMFAIKSAISRQLDEREALSPVQRELTASVLAGGLSGFAWAAPFEGLMVRRQVATLAGQNMSLRDTLRESGVIGLWQGGLPTAAREMVFASMIFAPVTIKHELLPQSFVADHPHLSSEVAACIAGIMGAGVNNPADVVKSRMQADPSQKSVIRVIKDLWRQEGPWWGFRGFGLRALSYSWGTLIISTVTGTLTEVLEEQLDPEGAHSHTPIEWDDNVLEDEPPCFKR